MENVVIPMDDFEYYVRQDERLRILARFIELWDGDIPTGILHVVMNEAEEYDYQVKATPELVEKIIRSIHIGGEENV